MNDWLNDYIVSEIPLRNTVIGNPMWIQKAPKNRSKANTFQMALAEL